MHSPPREYYPINRAEQANPTASSTCFAIANSLGKFRSRTKGEPGDRRFVEAEEFKKGHRRVEGDAGNRDKRGDRFSNFQR